MRFLINGCLVPQFPYFKASIFFVGLLVKIDSIPSFPVMLPLFSGLHCCFKIKFCSTKELGISICGQDSGCVKCFSSFCLFVCFLVHEYELLGSAFGFLSVNMFVWDSKLRYLSNPTFNMLIFQLYIFLCLFYTKMDASQSSSPLFNLFCLIILPLIYLLCHTKISMPTSDRAFFLFTTFVMFLL